MDQTNQNQECGHHPPGTGIVLELVDNAAIGPGNTVYQNGQNGEDLNGGAEGIMAFSSNNIWIHDNTVYKNSNLSAVDGGGIDIDGQNTNVLVERNFTHDNAADGLHMCPWGTWAHNVIRYNISVN